MKVLLINPPYDTQRYMGGLSKMAFVFQPIGLTYIAAYLNKNNIEVKIYDSQVESDPILEVIKKYQPQIVGITAVTFLVPSAIELSRLIKKDFPNLVIIAGGIHPTIRPQDFLNEPTIDFVAQGEGEETMYEFVRAIDDKSDPTNVPGIMGRRDGEFVSGPKRSFVKNLDDLPPPLYEGLKMDLYRVSPDVRTGERPGILLTSRGCPFDCIFCSNRMLTDGLYRAHSINRVCEEIERLEKNYGVTQLFIQDDNFAVNKKRAKAICREFIKRGYHNRFTWWCEARVDCVDEELLKLMADSGCRIISYGLESGNQRLLDKINKGITLERVKEVVAMTKRVGIDVRATFILGLPTETREESYTTIRFAKKLRIDQVRFSLATPFPGTKLWDIAQEEGTLDVKDWRHFSMMAGYATGRAIYAPKGRDPRELAKLQRRANLCFFLRPRVILNYAKRMTDRQALKDIGLGGLRFIKASLFPN